MNVISYAILKIFGFIFLILSLVLLFKDEMAANYVLIMAVFFILWTKRDEDTWKGKEK